LFDLDSETLLKLLTERDIQGWNVIDHSLAVSYQFDFFFEIYTNILGKIQFEQMLTEISGRLISDSDDGKLEKVFQSMTKYLDLEFIITLMKPRGLSR
jgi:hypothetical protein